MRLQGERVVCCWMVVRDPLPLVREITSAFFHESGNLDVVNSEQFIISVSGPRITGRQSLITLMFTLSGPGDLFVGIDEIMRLTSVQLIGWKLNRSVGTSTNEDGSSGNEILINGATCAAESADVKKLIKVVSQYFTIFAVNLKLFFPLTVYSF